MRKGIDPRGPSIVGPSIVGPSIAKRNGGGRRGFGSLAVCLGDWLLPKRRSEGRGQDNGGLGLDKKLHHVGGEFTRATQIQAFRLV